MKKRKNIFILLIIMFVVLLNLYLNFIPTGLDFNKPNAQDSLYIPNAYHTKELTHPSIVDFKKKWNKYQYWLAFTPYEKKNSDMENPHVVASNDLINWKLLSDKDVEIDVPKNKFDKKEYNSDPELVIDEQNNTLQLFWRRVNHNKGEVIIYRVISKDGINWSTKQEVLKSKFKKEALLSPSIIIENGLYKMWYANKDGYVYYRSSSDANKWSYPQKVNIKFDNPKTMTWHLSVKKIDKYYEILLTTFEKSHHKPRRQDQNNMNLQYSKSKNNRDWSTPFIIIRPSQLPNHFDSKNIYRASFIKRNDEYIIFYSAFGFDKTAGIGISYGENLKKLTGLLTNEKNFK